MGLSNNTDIYLVLFAAKAFSFSRRSCKQQIFPLYHHPCTSSTILYFACPCFSERGGVVFFFKCENYTKQITLSTI